MALGFVPSVINQGHMQGWEYKGAAAEAFTVGEALKINSSGYLTKASGTDTPKYISMFQGTVTAAGTEIPAIAVDHDALYDVPSSEAMTSRKVGDKVTIYTDGAKITATTTSGVAEIVKLPDTASGGIVTVRL